MQYRPVVASAGSVIGYIVAIIAVLVGAALLWRSFMK
jgi:hypothetical protein